MSFRRARGSHPPAGQLSRPASRKLRSKLCPAAYRGAIRNGGESSHRKKVPSCRRGLLLSAARGRGIVRPDVPSRAVAVRSYVNPHRLFALYFPHAAAILVACNCGFWHCQGDAPILLSCCLLIVLTQPTFARVSSFAKTR